MTLKFGIFFSFVDFVKCARCETWTDPREENCADLFRLLAPPPLLPSSNWPVITNLRTSADVRYDHVPRSLHGPVRGASEQRPRVTPRVTPCQRTTRTEPGFHVSAARRKLSPPSACVRAGVCVTEPRYSAAVRSSPLDLEKLCGGGTALRTRCAITLLTPWSFFFT